MPDEINTNILNAAEARTSGWLRGREVMQIKPPDFAVDGILPAKSLSLLCGHPGSCKSFIAVDIGLCIATGKPWLGPTPFGKAVWSTSRGRDSAALASGCGHGRAITGTNPNSWTISWRSTIPWTCGTQM